MSSLYSTEKKIALFDKIDGKGKPEKRVKALRIKVISDKKFESIYSKNNLEPVKLNYQTLSFTDIENWVKECKEHILLKALLKALLEKLFTKLDIQKTLSYLGKYK